MSQEALRAAELLAGNGLYRSSIDRSYYAAFHAASALLAANGIFPGTHDGVIAMLSLHFVKTGALPKVTARRLQDLLNQRLIADYKGYLDQDASDAESCVSAARDLLAQIPPLLERTD